MLIPAPKLHSSALSHFFIVLSFVYCDRSIGIDADAVLPTYAMLESTLPVHSSHNLFPIWSSILWFAWCRIICSKSL